MQIHPILLLGCLVCCVSMAAPVAILNPSGEINNGIDKTSISSSSVISWNAAGGNAQVIEATRTNNASDGSRYAVLNSSKLPHTS